MTAATMAAPASVSAMTKMADYTRRSLWRDWYWLVGGATVLLVITGQIIWNTAYSSGRADGIEQLTCVQQVQAKMLQGMTEQQQEDYLNSSQYHYPKQCP